MQLLISVRNAHEAQLAAENGAQRLDLKEPKRGSLGATSINVWNEIVPRFQEKTPVSLALGELHDASIPIDIPTSTDSVKVGLSNCRDDRSWQEQLASLYDQLPKQVARVAVYYADEDRANSPEFNDVLEVAGQLDCRYLLIDTFDKSGGSVFHHWNVSELIAFRNLVKDAGLQFALAGSIRHHHLPAVGQINPDIVAIRGAICHSDRTGEIDLTLLHSFRCELSQQFRHHHGETKSPDDVIGPLAHDAIR